MYDQGEKPSAAAVPPLRVGIAGLGTVGSGLVKLLQQHGKSLELRLGRTIEIVAVSARDRTRDRGFDASDFRWVEDPLSLARDPSIEVVVELIGGAEGVARSLVEAALEAGKHVVTANKALLAYHGTELAGRAERAGRVLAFEAAVAGGIPIVKTLREGLAANGLSRIYGILNGTSNFILTAMGESGRGFADVLAEAQTLGFAEADPSFDVDGIDAAHKLAILTSLAFGTPVEFGSMHIEGIRQLAALDFEYAAELGFRLKLLGVARLTPDGIEQRVHPTMVPAGTPIAHVDGVFNAVVAEGDSVGRVVLEGRGAGAGPTASAVAADLIDIARGNIVPAFGWPTAALQSRPAIDIAHHEGAYYMRLSVIDRPGVIADVTAALRDEQVSMESMIQRGRAPGEAVNVVLTTHVSEEAAIRRSLTRISALSAVLEAPVIIRIEHL